MKTVANALQITARARRWLEQSSGGRVLGVYEQAVNLANPAGELLVLATSTVGPGPFSLVLSPDVAPLARHIAAGDSVRVSAGLLEVGRLEVTWAEAETWEARPGWSRLHDRSLPLPALRQLLLAVAPPDSLADLLLPSSAARNRWAQAAEPGAHLLAQGLAAANQTLGRRGAAALAGLGPGLTPAGDDFLMGVIYYGWATEPVARAATWAAALVGAAAPRTNQLSRAWLRAAGRGETGRAWHGLVAALAQGEAVLGPAVQAIVSTGHTSGADALAGFLWASDAR